MARKMMILTGSPRAGGNTQTTAEWVAAGAAEAGAEVETVDVTKLASATNGCTACMACQKSEKFECVIDDEVSAVLSRIRDADAVVFATPVYFFGPTAQLKLLLDRMFCLLQFSEDGSVRTAGEKLVVGIVSSGGGGLRDGLSLVEQTFKNLEGFLAREVKSLLLPNAPFELGRLAADEERRAEATAFGRSLAQA